MMQINVYIINPVVMGVPNNKFVQFYVSSANELKQNSNASSREEYIPQILTVLLEILRVDT